MATNNFGSNFTRMLARIFLEKFEAIRVLSKQVNTQLLAGKFSPKSGTQVDFKRPTDYRAVETPDGNISGSAPNNDIITGKATGTVQNYITVDMDFDEVDQSLKMDQLDQLLAPAATRIVTQLELNFSLFMMKNAALLSGTPGTGASKWSEVARAGALMQSIGIPMDEMWTYAINPYTQAALADIQRSLGAGGVAGELVKTAHEKAILSDNFAGMRVMSATTLSTYTNIAEADLVGAVVTADPDETYLTAKDTMTQSIQVTGFGTFSGTVPAGTKIQITGRNRLNLSTRQLILDENGLPIVFDATLVADATLTGGVGTFVVTGPGLFETAGQYNTIDSKIIIGDVVTILGANGQTLQPNLFFHKQAFGIGSVSIQKLFSTDTLAETEDGMLIRVSKFADGLENKQIVRFDLLPAFAVFNPFFAGHGYGTP